MHKTIGNDARNVVSHNLNKLKHKADSSLVQLTGDQQELTPLTSVRSLRC